MSNTAKIKEFKTAFKKPSPKEDVKSLERNKIQLEKLIKQGKKNPPINIKECQQKIEQMRQLGDHAYEYVQELVAYKLTKHWENPKEFEAWSTICGDSSESQAEPLRRMILAAKNDSKVDESHRNKFVKECSERFKGNEVVQQTCLAIVPHALPKQFCEKRLENLKLDHFDFDRVLKDQIQLAKSLAANSKYEEANQLLDQIDQDVFTLREKLRDDFQGTVDQLDLQQVQQLIKHEYKGTKVGSSAVGRLSNEQREKLLKEKGVDVEMLTQRALASGRKPEELLLRAAEFALCCPEIESELIEDLALCADILRDEKEALKQFEKLEGQLRVLAEDEPKKEGKEYGKHALSKALSEVETKHCFPDIDSLPVGILTSETFLGMTSWGYTPKDPGAGGEHGEFTHRLQWNILMNRFESDKENNSDWKFTPFELFTRIGKTDEESSKQGGGSVWNFMLDAAGADEQLVFGSPDYVTSMFRKMASEEEGNELKLLSTIVSDRATKRIQGANAEEFMNEATRISEKLDLELAMHKQAIQSNKPNCRSAFLNWVETNKEFLNLKHAKLDPNTQTNANGVYQPVWPGVLHKNNIAYAMSMEAYKKKKLDLDTGEGKTEYKLLDESNQDDLLLVGTGEEDLTLEEKEDRVVEMQSRSRKQFGLKAHEFSDRDREVLERRIKQLKSFQPLATVDNITIDEEGLLNLALAKGLEAGLWAAIDEVEQGEYKDIWELVKQWRVWSRDLLRQIQRVKSDLQKKNIDADLEKFVKALTDPITPALAAQVKSGEFIKQLASAAKGAEQKLIDGLKNFSSK